MTMTLFKRSVPERMLQPASLSLSGTHTALGRIVMANIQSGHFSGPVGTDAEPYKNADLAIVADEPADVGRALAAHAQRGTRGAIVVSAVPDLLRLAKPSGMRVIGPHSFGILLPAIGLNASALHLAPAPGGVALVAQSASLARAIIDWAVPNSAGFSQIIGIGGNADIGFGLVLDHLSRDPATKAILIEIDRLRDPKQVFSAARAAARLRPVVALAPGARLHDQTAASRAGFEAAFARAGVLLTETFGEFLAAAETLVRVKPAHSNGLAILSNSVSAGRLAADYAIKTGISLSRFSLETQRILGRSLDTAPPFTGPIYAGQTSSTKLADLAALLSSAPEVGGILVVHTPSGEADDTAIAALMACAKTVKIPLLIATMGEASGAEHRRRLAHAGLACFETPEAAINGFHHLIRHRGIAAAARELPASKVLKTVPNIAAAQAAIATTREAGRDALIQDEALAVVATYKVPVIAGQHATSPEEAAVIASGLGFPAVIKLSYPGMPTHRIAGSVALDLPDARAVREAARAIIARLENHAVNVTGVRFLVQQQAPRGTQLRIHVADDTILGPIIGFGAGGGDPDDTSDLSADLPPLNLKLAQALIARSKVAPLLAAHRGAPAADLEAVAETLVRISQLIIDTPEILLLDLDPIFAHEHGIVATSARILLRPAGSSRPPLIISPYPAELATSFETKGETFTIRPIRPEDASAHAAFFTRLSPEDVRFRFFSPMRTLPPEQTARMTDVDYDREIAFIAVRENNETAGVARLIRNDTDGTRAEFAIVIDAGAKRKGVATLLMRAIIDWGKTQGVILINGQILADNTAMLAFVRHLGFTVAHIPGESDIVEARLLCGLHSPVFSCAN
jgi:acetyltransferase